MGKDRNPDFFKTLTISTLIFTSDCVHCQLELSLELPHFCEKMSMAVTGNYRIFSKLPTQASAQVFCLIIFLQTSPLHSV